VSYLDFAEAICGSGLLADPWVLGHERFRAEPVVLPASRYAEFCAAAEAVAAVHGELAQLAAADARVVEFLGLSRCQRLVWEAAAPHWHGVARADVFATAAGPKVCELNSDTPSGQAEAVVLGALGSAAHPELADVNAGLGARLLALFVAAGRAIGAEGPLTVGILHPTDIPEDLSMVALYERVLAAAGHRIALGSPFDLGRAPDGRVTLLGTPCDVVVRHYKTDWWCERLPARSDEPPVPDDAPLRAELTAILGAAIDGRTAVVNPFGAVVTQNKRALAFCWEQIERFSAPAQIAIRRYLPRTLRLEVAAAAIADDRARWVLKSDYGCEGDEVVIGAAVGQAEWTDALAHAIPGRWVAQEFFAAERDAGGEIVNHGVYLIAGRAAGAFARVHRGLGTDLHARAAAVLCTRDEAQP
jgi:glutathionylspermidine synthase